MHRISTNCYFSLFCVQSVSLSQKSILNVQVFCCTSFFFHLQCLTQQMVEFLKEGKLDFSSHSQCVGMHKLMTTMGKIWKYIEKWLIQRIFNIILKTYFISVIPSEIICTKQRLSIIQAFQESSTECAVLMHRKIIFW